MSISRPPAFQFYPKDFLAHAKQAAMTAAEAGIYIRLLCHCWLTGWLPADDDQLARMAAVTTSEFLGARSAVLSCFVFCEKTEENEPKFIHKRLSRERRKQVLFRQEQRRKGVIGAKQRWHRPSSGYGTGHHPAMAQAQPKHGSPISDLRSSYLREERTNTPRSRAESLFEQFWDAYPKKRGKDAAMKAFKRRSPTEALLQEILTALKWQRQQPDWLKDGGQFVPYPATWLNAGRWQDEPVAVDAPDADALAAEIARQDKAAGL